MSTVRSKRAASRTRARLASALAVALSGALSVACGAELESVSVDAPSGAPNVVLIVVDTLRGDMVMRDDARARTPGFDRLATDGVVFEHAFSHAPMTLPAHTALFSSRLPHETGVLNNGQPVPEDLPLLADWFRRHGYATRAVVSLGTLDPFGGNAGLTRGFDAFGMDYWRMDQAPRVVDRLVATLDALSSSEPFFLFAHFCDPHAPYNSHEESDLRARITLDGELLESVPTRNMSIVQKDVELDAGTHVLEVASEEVFAILGVQLGRGGRTADSRFEEGELRKPSERARVAFEVEAPGTYALKLWLVQQAPARLIPERYVGEVEFVDRALAGFLDELRARGLYDDALVVLTSDHGEAIQDRSSFAGHVDFLYDEFLHVPLAIKPPAGDPSRATLEGARDRLVPHLDLAPTILEIAGLPPLPGQRGTSLLAPSDPVLFAETHRPEAKRDLFCMRDAEFKLILDLEARRFEMFDVVNDPGETTDVFETMRERRPDWPIQLEALSGAVEIDPEADEGDLDPETLERLRALGYFDGEE